ncbi:MAG: hypothetical protein EOO57_12170 [Hymenobacter sp.]|nr:MAG: hypothetical protein EOO57_12170 [Hymenobacter sp.]
MDETVTAHNADCTLTVTATYQPGAALRLRHQLLNFSAWPLYVCSQLPELTSPTGPDESVIWLRPGLVHIEVEPQGVQLAKASRDLSFHDGIRALAIPHLSAVQPGQTLEQEIEVAVPMQPYRAFGKRPGQAPAIPLALWFTLGYFRGTPELVAGLTVVQAGPPGTYEVDFTQSWQEVRVAVGPFSELVPVANATPNTSPLPPVAPRRAAAMPAAPPLPPAPVGGYAPLRDKLRREAAEFRPEAPETPLSGTVQLRLTIGADGKIQQTKVVRGLRADYDAEAQRLVCDGPGWVPGVSGGRRAPLDIDIAVPF